MRTPVAKAYRELEREGVVELRQGAGAFVADTARARQGGGERLRGNQPLVARNRRASCARGLGDDEIRRLFEAELAGIQQSGRQVADELIIETADVRKSYGSVQALRRSRLARAARRDLRSPRARTAPARRRRSRCCSAWCGRRRAKPASSGSLPTTRARASRFVAALRSSARTRMLYAGMTRRELLRFTAPFYPKWRADLASSYLAQLELRAGAPPSRRSRAACARSSRCCSRSRRAPSC